MKKIKSLFFAGTNKLNQLNPLVFKALLVQSYYVTLLCYFIACQLISGSLTKNQICIGWDASTYTQFPGHIF